MFEWITGVVRGLGYLGIGLLTFLENIFPPIPSELIMPLAGFLTVREDMSFALAVGAGTLGSAAGTFCWYAAARRVRPERLRAFVRRHGRWLTIGVDDLDRARDWFQRRGGISVFVGRLVPGVRTLISVPAAFGGMAVVPFVLYTLLGTALWTAILTFAGRLLGSNYRAVESWLSPASTAIVAGLVVWYIYRVIRCGRSSRAEG